MNRPIINNFLLKSFCFCCSLRTGTMVVGIFSLFSGIGVFVMSMITLTEKSSDDEENTDCSAEECKSETSSLLYSILLIISSILTISTAVFVLIASWKNRRHRFLLPWLILNPLWMIVGNGFSFYYAIFHWIEQEVAMGIGYAAASVSIAAIGIFCWLVICSYYYELRQVNKKNAENLP